MNTQHIRECVIRVADDLGHPRPSCALILGSGWGDIIQALTVKQSIAYADVPVLGATGVFGHRGILHLATHTGLDLLVFQGRRHWYEGAGWEPVVFPIDLCVHLGVPVLVATNAAGGIRPDLEPGDLMVIDDHINAMGTNPLIGPHYPAWGPRFPDQTQVYDSELRDLLDRAAEAAHCRLRHGVYLAAAGPTYETPAEVAAYRALGADAVGMSTVPEAMVAHSAGMRVAGLSCVTNRAAGFSGRALSHEEVLQAARAAAPRMQALLLEFLKPRLPHPMNTPVHIHTRELAREAVWRLQSAGHVALWAGGCVRDILMERTPKDYDIATSATPDEVLRLFPNSLAVGKAFGVVRASLEDTWFEIATFREDHAYRDGRHPESVSFADAPADAGRRDFTINAIFCDPIADRYIDTVGGREDIARRLIRCVGDPDLRFQEDYLRMLRAVRFAATLDFTIEEHTAAAIRRLRQHANEISPERIREELSRLLLEAKRPGDGLMLIDAMGLLEVLLPEVAALKGQAQPPAFHPEGDVFTHTVRMLNAMRHPELHLAFAVLLHDIGKPATAVDVPGDRIRFDRHDSAGAEMAERILTRLRFSTHDAHIIAHCVRNHMHFLNVQKMKRSTLRRFVGTPDFATEMELHRLDCLASHGSLDNYDFIVEFRRRLDREPVPPAPWITGHDILRLGIHEGPEVGVWRRRAYDAQLENRCASREDLLRWLEQEIQAYMASSGKAPSDSRPPVIPQLP